MLTFNNTDLAQRTLDITQCPDHFLKHNSAFNFFDMFALITQAQSHYSLYSFWTRLKWLKITVFVGKTSSDSCGRSGLRIYMKQVTNLKSLGFTWKKQQIYWESPQVYDANISAMVLFVVDGVAKLTFVSVFVEAEDSPASALSTPLPPSLVLGNSTIDSIRQDGGQKQQD